MDKWLNHQWSVGWNYVSIPKLQWYHRWSLGMDDLFHRTSYWGCNYLSMLKLTLNHVSKSIPVRPRLGLLQFVNFPVAGIYRFVIISIYVKVFKSCSELTVVADSELFIRPRPMYMLYYDVSCYDQIWPLSAPVPNLAAYRISSDPAVNAG